MVEKAWRKGNPFMVLVANKWEESLERSMELPLRYKKKATLKHCRPTPNSIWGENQILKSHVHWTTIYNSQQIKANKMFMERWTDKEQVTRVYKELKSLLVKVKEEGEKAGLKLNIQKNKIMASSSITFMANRWGNNGNTTGLYFLWLQNHCRWWLQPWN